MRKLVTCVTASAYCGQAATITILAIRDRRLGRPNGRRIVLHLAALSVRAQSNICCAYAASLVRFITQHLAWHGCVVGVINAFYAVLSPLRLNIVT